MTAALGYLLTGALFVGLCAALATVWKDRQERGRLLAAFAASIVWAAAYAGELSRWSLPYQLGPIADALRAGAWYALLGSMLVSLGLRPRNRAVLRILWIGALAVTIVAQVLLEPTRPVVKAMLVLELLLAAGGLMLIEQLLRNSPVPNRWAVKYLCFGLGLAFAFDVYMFSEGVLLGAVDPDLVVARGYVNALGGAAICVAVRRNPRFDLVLSHGMVFFLGTAIAVGCYLLLMALGGYYVRVFGGDWGVVAQPVLLAAALLGLLVLLFSDTVRSKFKVFLHKHFKRYKYDYRHEWLRFTRTLSDAAGQEDILATSIRAMAQIVESPGGVMWVADDRGNVYHPVAAVPPGSEPRESGVRASDALLEFLAARRWIVDLRELRAAPARYDPLVVPEWVTARPKAWLVIPLLLGSTLVGFVVLDEAPVPTELNFEDHDLLKMVGRDVATHVSQYEASRRLAESQQFATYHRLSAFVMHDLKNLIAQLSLVVRNAEKHRRNPEFVDDSIATIANSVERMRRLIGQLGSSSPASGQHRVSLGRILETVVGRAAARVPRPRLVLQDPDAEVLADPERLASVLGHVVSNAQDAAGERGTVTVALASHAGFVHVMVTDDGPGMDQAFVRTKLFKPFETTKGEAGMGIGAYQVREYVRVLGGKVAVQSAPGCGTTFEICLPIAASAGFAVTES